MVCWLGSRVKSKQGRFVCYIRQGLLHCETLELTVADEAMLHRVERSMIYMYYILSYTEFIQEIESV